MNCWRSRRCTLLAHLPLRGRHNGGAEAEGKADRIGAGHPVVIVSCGPLFSINLLQGVVASARSRAHLARGKPAASKNSKPHNLPVNTPFAFVVGAPADSRVATGGDPVALMAKPGKLERALKAWPSRP
jgi:hypothetical protein